MKAIKTTGNSFTKEQIEEFKAKAKVEADRWKNLCNKTRAYAWKKAGEWC